MTVRGVRVPLTPELMVPAVERELRAETYEAGEMKLLTRILRKGDRVLDLGAGLGLTSSTAALHPGVEAVMAFEADPRLIPHLNATYRENDISVDVHNAILVPGDVEPDRTFYVAKAFWASSHLEEKSKGRNAISVPTQSLRDILKTFRPTIISCDIEGGEYELLKDIELAGVRALVVEFHPKLLGPERESELKRAFRRQGFRPFPRKRNRKQVRAMMRGNRLSALRWRIFGR